MLNFYLFNFYSSIPPSASGLLSSSVSLFKSNNWTLLISSSSLQHLKIFWCPSVTGKLLVIYFFYPNLPQPSYHSKFYIFWSSFRYPTSKWVKLGTFHARDERIVQSFPLDEQLFAKYLKVVFLLPLCTKSVNVFEGRSFA